MMKTYDRYFYLFFLVSGVIHFYILTLNFVASDEEDKKEFKELKIKLGVQKLEKENQAPILPKLTSDIVKSNINNNNIDLEKKKVTSKRKERKKQEEIDLSHVKMDQFKQPDKVIKVSEEEIKKDAVDKKKKKLVKENKLNKPMKRVVETVSRDVVVPKTIDNSKSITPKNMKKKIVGRLGTKAGNSIDAESSDLITYEQMLPLWLEKFKVYPEQANILGLKGEGVIKITIKRNGKVLKAEIEESTGHPILDSALLTMVESADPVIPVPDDYYPEDTVFSYDMEFEFLNN